jgi:hypothetical protein
MRISPPRAVYLIALFSRLEDLRQSRRIGVGIERCGGQIQLESVALGVDRRTGGLDGAVNHAAQVDPFTPHLQLVLGDARDVEEVVRDPHEVQELALHGRARFLDHLGFAAGDAHHLERAADRGERIAQLVRQRRQELVLPPVGVTQRDLGELAIREVDADADAAIDLALRVVERRDVVLHVGHGAVASHQLDIVADEAAPRDRHLHG